MAARDVLNFRLMQQRRWEDGSLLSSIMDQQTKAVFGFPSWSFSRYRQQETLAKVAEERGVKIVWSARVVGVDEKVLAVRLEDGTVMKAD